MRERNCRDKDQDKYDNCDVRSTEREALRQGATCGGLLEKRPAARPPVLEAEPPDEGEPSVIAESGPRQAGLFEVDHLSCLGDFI